MPIGKDDTGHPTAYFGNGDIAVSTGRVRGDKICSCVVLHSMKQKHPVGEPRPENLGIPTDEIPLGDCIRLQFGSVASLDVLIHRLWILRAEMAWGPENPVPEKL